MVQCLAMLNKRRKLKFMFGVDLFCTQDQSLGFCVDITEFPPFVLISLFN